MRHVVEICCFCEKVRDEKPDEPGTEVWQDFKVYMATHHLRPADVRLWHTYCAPCLAVYRKFLASGTPVSESRNRELEP